MKNLTRILAFLLCVVFVVMAFASCGKKKKKDDATTAQPQTTGSVTPVSTERDWASIADDIAGFAASNRRFKVELDVLTNAERISKNKEYLEGPDKVTEGETALIEQYVYERNHNAMEDLGIEGIEYTYWDYGWNQQNPQIVTAVQGNAADAPDLFVNMVFDLNLALKTQGVFRDIQTFPGGYFDFDSKGWMKSWMESLSFTGDRAYILGSDYFLDILRAMGVLPFNMYLMDQNSTKLATAILDASDPLGADEQLSTRFFDFVEQGKWTYDALHNLCEAIWEDSDGSGNNSIQDVLGIVTDKYSGMPAALMLYSSGVHTHETTQLEDGRQWISLPESSEALGSIFDAVAGVFSGQGAFVTNDSTSKGATADTPGIPYHYIKFAENTLLFAGPALLSALEGAAFQGMEQLYSVVPLPKVNLTDDYNTIIHNTSDAGAINVNTNPQRARTISAYLQHVTEHSTEIRDEFLQIVMKYKNTTYDQGTDRMLDLIYDKVTNARDKAMEDTAESKGELRFHAKMKDHAFTWTSAEISSDYLANRDTKNAHINSVMNKWYNDLPQGTATYTPENTESTPEG